MRIFAVAQNTFREAVRDKVLYVLLFFAAVAICGSKVLGWISVGQDIKIIKDICLATLSVFGVLIAIFVGTSLVYKEVDKRTIYTILSRPMRRAEFVLGKFAGLAALLAMTTASMAVIACLYLLVMGGAPDRTFILAILLIYMQLLLITSVAVLFSSLTSPILGALLVFSLYVAGHATNILKELPPQFKDTLSEKILHIAYYVIPNLSNFNISPEAANGVPVTVGYVAWAVGYGLFYTALFLVLAVLAFEEKDV